MSRLLYALFLPILLASPDVQAGQAEAKEVALNANCKPGKVEVLRTTMGLNGETLYKVACAGQKDRFVVVRCHQQFCVLLR